MKDLIRRYGIIILMTDKSDNGLIKKFEKIGSTEIHEDGELETTILSIFQSYPNNYYTQPDLVKGLGKSNPFVNKILRRLVSNGKLSRVKNGNKFYYKLVQ